MEIGVLRHSVTLRALPQTQKLPPKTGGYTWMKTFIDIACSMEYTTYSLVKIYEGLIVWPKKGG